MAGFKHSKCIPLWYYVIFMLHCCKEINFKWNISQIIFILRDATCEKTWSRMHGSGLKMSARSMPVVSAYCYLKWTESRPQILVYCWNGLKPSAKNTSEVLVYCKLVQCQLTLVTDCVSAIFVDSTPKSPTCHWSVDSKWCPQVVKIYISWRWICSNFLGTEQVKVDWNRGPSISQRS